jgi:hypothetical protein
MHVRADMRSSKDQLFIINSDARRVCRTRESHQAGRGPRSGPSASLIKISAISRMDVPSDPESRAQSSPTGGAAGPPFSYLSLPSFLSFFWPPFPCRAVLCGRSDLLDTREEGGGRRGPGLKWRASGCQRARRAPAGRSSCFRVR